jgi:hypothetical protein
MLCNRLGMATFDSAAKQGFAYEAARIEWFIALFIALRV